MDEIKVTATTKVKDLPFMGYNVRTYQRERKPEGSYDLIEGLLFVRGALYREGWVYFLEDGEGRDPQKISGEATLAEVVAEFLSIPGFKIVPEE